MALKHNPGCNCCGCELFSFADLFTAESGFSTIDGYRVITRALPADGLWVIDLHPKITAVSTTTTDRVSFRLLKPDDTVFAEWSLAFWYDVVGSKWRRRTKLTMDWNGTIVTDNVLGALAFDTPVPATLTNRIIARDYIVGRQSCSTMFRDDPIRANNPITTQITNINNGSQPAPAALIDIPQDAESAGGDDPEWITNSKVVEYEWGFPLANDSAAFAAAGPFRLGIKFLGNPDTESLACKATGERIYQEGIDRDCYTAYHSWGPGGQTEKNVGCIEPKICPVTAPHYTSPLWQINSISSTDCTLYGTEQHYESRLDCDAYFGHYRLARATVPDIADYDEFIDEVVDINNMVGDWHFDAIEVYRPWAYTATAINHTQLVWKHTGIDDTDYTEYAKGSGLTFSSTVLSYDVITTVVATDDPCRWKVVAELRVYAWWALDPLKLGSFEVTYLTSGMHRRSIDGTLYYICNSWQTPTATSSGTGGNKIPANYGYKSVTYEKVVSAWVSEPPTVSFADSDRVSDLVTWDMLTALASTELLSASFNATITPSWSQVSNDSFTFSIKSRVSPRAAHP